jgi:hypothetical protein
MTPGYLARVANACQEETEESIKGGITRVNAREGSNHAAGVYRFNSRSRGVVQLVLLELYSIERKSSVYFGWATEAAVEPGRTMSPPAAAMKRAAVVAKPLIFLHSMARFCAGTKEREFWITRP